MHAIADVDDQITRTLTDLGAFDATCPGCGKGHAFGSTPRLRERATPWPGRRQVVTVLLRCTQCSYAAEHLIEVDWPVGDAVNAA